MSLVTVFRDKYAKAGGGVEVRIVGFAKVVGDLLEGLTQVMGYFAIAAAIATIIIYLWTRCARSTALVVACSLVAVLWQLGVQYLQGFLIQAPEEVVMASSEVQAAQQQQVYQVLNTSTRSTLR